MRSFRRSVAFKGRHLDVIWEGGAEYTRDHRSRGVVLVDPRVYLGVHLARQRGPTG